MKGSVYPRPYVKDPKTGKRRPVKGSTWTWQINGVIKAGKRTTPSKGGFRTKEEAEEALAVALVEYGQGAASKVEPSKQSVSAYLVEWLEGRQVKPATRASYTNAIAAISSHIGDVRLCDLTATQIVAMYRKLRSSGGTTRAGKKDERTRSLPMSERSVHKCHVVMTGALGYAAQTGRLRVNPMTLIPKSDRPKQSGGPHREMEAWTAEQARTFLAAAESDRYAPIYDLALNTGMRRGELAGLRWADVDLPAKDADDQKGTISIRRNRVPVNWQVHEGTPKSTKPRVIDIDPDTVAMLRRHRVKQLEERMAWGAAGVESDYLFTREDGTPQHPETIGWHFERLAKKAKLPMIGIHGLRHTHATLGLAAGVPLKVMSERLGHATTQITADLYQHVIPGMGADAAAKIGALLRAAH